MTTLRVLILEDWPLDSELLVRELRRSGFEPQWKTVDDEAGFLAGLDPGLDLILADYHLPQFDALSALRLMQERGLGIPFIIVTGAVGDEVAAECIKQGADDYLLKDRIARLGLAVTQAIEKRSSRLKSKQQEQALRESEERFATIYHTNPVALQITAIGSGEIIDVNARWEEVFGVPLEQALGRKSSEVLTFLDSSIGPRMMMEADETGRYGERETLIRLPDGEVHKFVFRSEPITLDGHRVMISACQDITERKRAEEALRHERDLLSTLVDALPDEIYFKDDAGCFTRTNRAHASKLGYGVPANVVGKTDFDILYTETARQAYADEREIVRTGKALVNKSELVRVAGQTDRWVSTTKVPVRDDNDNVVGIVGISRDITEQKATQEALAASERKYRQLVELAYEGIWATDPNMLTTFVNPRMAEMLGYTADEMIDKHISAFTDEPGLSLARLHAERRRLGVSEEYDREYIRKDGSRMYARVHASPITDDEAQYLGSIRLLSDTTEQRRADEDRRQLEQQLYQAQKMEAIGTLAGGIAHDLNNVLGIIMGNASLMEMSLSPSSEMTDSVTAIDRACEQGAALTRQLLGFARRGKVEVRPIDPAVLIGDVANMIRRTFDRSIDIRTQADVGTWPALGDPNQIHQVLMNLAINSRDAMPDGGVLTLSATSVSLDESHARLRSSVSSGRYVVLTVADTGTGMTKETRSRIFDPFFTTKEAGRGTGLGLASAYGIVRNHGGHIDVESKLGAGTVMRVYLPAASATCEDGSQGAKSVEVPHGSATILLVDDEKAIRDVGSLLLKRMGYSVMQASDGVEGVELYRSRRSEIALVVLDMNMPVQGGRETARQLLDLNPECRILVASGYGEEAEAGTLPHSDNISFLRKPFRAEQLAEAVGLALTRGG